MSHFNTIQVDKKEDGSQRKQQSRRRYDSRSVAKYVTQLNYQSKEVYDVFRNQAIDSGLYKEKPEPLPRVHRNYYDKYIRFTQGTPLPSERAASSLFDRSNTNQSQLTAGGSNGARARSKLKSGLSKQAETYIPLRDLLRHNHEERVQGYLKLLNQEEEEFEKMRDAKKQLQSPQKPQVIVENAESTNNGGSVPVSPNPVL